MNIDWYLKTRKLEEARKIRKQKRLIKEYSKVSYSIALGKCNIIEQNKSIDSGHALVKVEGVKRVKSVGEFLEDFMEYHPDDVAVTIDWQKGLLP